MPKELRQTSRTSRSDRKPPGDRPAGRDDRIAPLRQSHRSHRRSVRASTGTGRSRLGWPSLGSVGRAPQTHACWSRSRHRIAEILQSTRWSRLHWRPAEATTAGAATAQVRGFAQHETRRSPLSRAPHEALRNHAAWSRNPCTNGKQSAETVGCVATACRHGSHRCPAESFRDGSHGRSRRLRARAR